MDELDDVLDIRELKQILNVSTHKELSEKLFQLQEFATEIGYMEKDRALKDTYYTTALILKWLRKHI